MCNIEKELLDHVFRVVAISLVEAEDLDVLRQNLGASNSSVRSFVRLHKKSIIRFASEIPFALD